MTETMQISTTILDQIKTLDHWALGAWGARQFVTINPGPSTPEIGPVLGGVSFKIKTPKYMKGVKVLVYYTADDLYNIRVCRIINFNITEIKTVTGIYCDQLVEIIDGIIENGRR